MANSDIPVKIEFIADAGNVKREVESVRQSFNQIFVKIGFFPV